MFTVRTGDLFESKLQTLVNPVNCVGVMGKGLALEFKRRFPPMFDDYVARCDSKAVKLGQPYLYRDVSGLLVVNFPTKGHWRSPSHLHDIDDGLDYLGRHIGEWEVRSLALPALGCGYGGLHWTDVGPLIYRKLCAQPIDIDLYAPNGTPATELTEKFLSGAC